VFEKGISAGCAGFKAPYKKEAFSPGYFLEMLPFTVILPHFFSTQT